MTWTTDWIASAAIQVCLADPCPISLATPVRTRRWQPWPVWLRELMAQGTKLDDVGVPVMQQLLAIAIISGLIVQLPLVLFLMPSVYLVTEKARHI
jgi:hypothetical protein